MSLPTNYQSAVFSGNRKYQMIQNGDGTVSFVDVTQYSQQGSQIGGGDFNDITTAINNLTGDFDVIEVVSSLPQNPDSRTLYLCEN